MIQVLVIIGVFLTIYICLTKRYNYWKNRCVPYKKPAFLFGNLYDIVVKGKSFADYFGSLYEEFNEPHFGFFGMNEPFLFVKDISIIKQILVTDFHIFSRKAFLNDEKIDPLFSSVLFGLGNPTWAALRSKLTPSFTPSKIKNTFTYVIENVNTLCDCIHSSLDSEVNIKDISARYSTDVLAKFAFGVQANALTSSKCKCFEAANRQFSSNFVQSLMPLIYIFAHPLVKIFRFKFIDGKAGNYLKHLFAKVIEERKASSFKNNDLVDLLFSLKNNETEMNGFFLNDDRLAAQSIILFIAGNESISNTITLTLLELAVLPSLQNRLRTEIQTILGIHGELSYDNIQEMKYLRMVISETLRKYPMTPFLHRTCSENYIIQKTGLGLEPGQKILISVKGLHWDPQYFPKPEIYDPERFSESNKHKIVEGSYIPFSIGPRRCIGSKFAELAIQVPIIKILLNYNVKTSSYIKLPIQFGSSFFLRSRNEIKLKFTKLK